MSQLLPFLHDEPLPPSRNDRSLVRRAVAVMSLVALIVGVIWVVVTVRAILPEQSASFSPGTPTTVVISSGDSLTVVGQRLADAGVVSSVSAFLAGAALDERSSSIGPGVYNLVTGLTPAEAIDRILDPAFREPPLVIREGLRLGETISVTSATTGIPEADLFAVLSSPDDELLPKWVPGRFEGVLFPATYTVLPGMSGGEVIGNMVERFNIAVAETKLVKKAKRMGYRPYEVLTIASLIQAEAAPQDFRKVSRVIYNRLNIGQRLELDSTVNFALGTSTLLITEDMLNTASPYNTFRNEGLPPTPINSPGQAAIEAALDPAKGDWLYFVTVNPLTGNTKFTSSYDEFLEFKAQFKRTFAEQIEQGLIDPGPTSPQSSPQSSPIQ